MQGKHIPILDDFAEAEHLVLEDSTVECPTLSTEIIARTEQRELTEQIEIRDRLRKRRTLVRLYSDGQAEVALERPRGSYRHRIDLRYLDSVPSVERNYPVRLLKAAAVVAGLTIVAAIPASFGWLSAYSVPTAFAGLGLTLACLFIAYYLSHERIAFMTLHGRAETIRFGAGLGTIRRFRKLVPQISEAIATVAVSITDPTEVYLRSEMREHYRLRGDGVLTEQECAESTGRILESFDRRRRT